MGRQNGAVPLKDRAYGAELRSVVARRARKGDNATPGSVLGERELSHPSLTVMGRKKKKGNGDNRRPRLILSFDEEKRR